MAKPSFVPPIGWDQHSIKAEIFRQGMTINALAEKAKLDISAFSQVWTRANRKAERAISDFLELKPEELWPDRYQIRTLRLRSSKTNRHSASQKNTNPTDRKAA